MEQHAKNDGKELPVSAALEYLRLGFRPLPLRPQEKGARIRWKEFQTRPPTQREVIEWFRNGLEIPNIALVTGSGVVVLDIDDPQLLPAVLEHCGHTEMICKTPRGFHAWYRMRQGVRYGNAVNVKHEGKTKNKSVDLRCEGSYAIVPWSRTEHGSYEWIGPVRRPDDLPILKVGWLRERKPKRKVILIERSYSTDIIVRRARAYLAKIEPLNACKGKCHCTRMRVAGVLCQKFGLSIEEAMPLFQEWNARCFKPASDSALLHKLKDAVRLRAETGLKSID